MDVRRALPHPALRGIVRSFGERRASLGKAVLTWPLPARPHQIIDVYLAEPFKLRIDNGALQTAPDTVVVGPQGARRIQLYMPREISHLQYPLAARGPQPPGRDRHDGADQ